MCETKRVGEPPCSDRAWLATGWLPEADPFDRVVAEDLQRQLDPSRAVAREAARGVVLDRHEHDAGGAEEDDEGRQRPPRASGCGSPATIASASVTTKSAAMLDCEYENQSPAKRSPISGSARSGLSFR